jgi:hypothetical protein
MIPTKKIPVTRSYLSKKKARDKSQAFYETESINQLDPKTQYNFKVGAAHI